MNRHVRSSSKNSRTSPPTASERCPGPRHSRRVPGHALSQRPRQPSVSHDGKATLRAQGQADEDTLRMRQPRATIPPSFSHRKHVFDYLFNISPLCRHCLSTNAQRVGDPSSLSMRASKAVTHSSSSSIEIWLIFRCISHSKMFETCQRSSIP